MRTHYHTGNPSSFRLVPFPNFFSTVTVHVTLVVVLVLLPAFTAGVASPDALALLAFKSAADNDDRLLYSSSSVKYYCRWQGVVKCSSAGRVTKLVLEDVGLRGTIGDHTLGLLDQLRILSLKNNSLTGPVPDFSTLSNLKALFLAYNKFSGFFPPSLVSLRRIRTLDLSRNNLTGPIPLAAAYALPHLYCFLVDGNGLNGSVPPFNQSSLSVFNVSHNRLSGPVPVTSVLLRMDSSMFIDNPGLCGTAVRRECGRAFSGDFFKLPSSSSSSSSSPVAPASPAEAMTERGEQLQDSMLPEDDQDRKGAIINSNDHPHKKKKKVLVGFSIFLVVLVTGLLSVLLAIRKKRQILPPQKGTAAAAAAADAMELCWDEDDARNDNSTKRLRSNCSGELVAATSISEEKVKKLGKSGCLMFCAGEASTYTLEQLMRASAEMLGKGSVGTTYKAVLDNCLIVGVKRLDAAKMGTTGKEAFDRHMDTVGKLRHPNVVPLRAFFQSKEERLLVYDYQPNGSLYSLIHGSRSTNAKTLHWTSCLKIAEDVAQGVAYIHQASGLVHGNIKSSNVLLGVDFEACITDSCLKLLVELSEGEEELGYRAPEARNSNRHLTPKSDIYSFGILLLELLTGKPPLQHTFLLATDLPVWVRSVRENGGEDERLMMLLGVAIACVKSLPESRPTAWQVLKMIQEVKKADLEENDLESSSIP